LRITTQTARRHGVSEKCLAAGSFRISATFHRERPDLGIGTPARCSPTFAPPSRIDAPITE
jgi:hypothetical protein